MMRIRLLTLLAIVSACSTRVVADEGLFAPSQLTPPFHQTRVLGSIARVRENIYWDTIVLNDKHDVDTLKKSFKYYAGTGRKTYLPQGVILWHIVLTKDDLLAMMEDPASQYEVGISDIIRSFNGVKTFPAERITPISGWASATFISRDGLLITNYHVVREQIEALHRESGCSGEVPAPYLLAEIARVRGGRIVEWVPVRSLDLVANLSSTDWQGGLDGALLRVRDSDAHEFLPVRSTPPSVGEPVWVYGFPYATHRTPSRLRRIGYTNADQTLRVSFGRVTQLKAPDFIVDADGINGDSGGPTIDRNGSLLGYVWDIYGQSISARVTSFAGGDIIVSAQTALQRLKQLQPCVKR